jgi:hypothetical protein
MRPLAFALLLITSFALAQDNPAPTTDNSKPAKGAITIQGCVSRSNGDYILIKQDPGVSYELQSTGKIKLKNYLGQRVEVSGEQSPSLSNSSDQGRNASPVTITIRSIKTVDKECPAR